MSTFNKFLKKIRLKKDKPLTNPNGRPKKELDIKLILQYKQEGLSNCEIARRLKVSEGTIRNRLKKITN